MMAEVANTQPAAHDPMMELKAMEAVHAALVGLTPEARNRVVAWAVGALQVVAPAIAPVPDGKGGQPPQQRPAANLAPEEAAPASYPTFADLFSAASPKTNAEKALVGGYWLQVCQGAESFVSMSINNELKNLGEGVDNITSAFDGLKDVKPQLALQVRKEGKSQQARKLYKLTVAGVRSVDAMIRGERPDG
jgi:hypothetical protein